jgi:hypothetical protein
MNIEKYIYSYYMNIIIKDIQNLIIQLKNKNLSEKQREEIELNIYKKCLELKKIKTSS